MKEWWPGLPVLFFNQLPPKQNNRTALVECLVFAWSCCHGFDNSTKIVSQLLLLHAQGTRSESVCCKQTPLSCGGSRGRSHLSAAA